MPKERMSLFYESEKIRAIKYCCEEKGVSFNEEIEKQLDGLYQRMVPENLRKYIDATMTEPQKTKKSKLKNKNIQKPDTVE